MIDSRYLSLAFENAIEILGERAANAIVEDLRNNDVYLCDPDLTLEKLGRGINLVLGYEAAALITERVKIELDALCSVAS